MTTNKGKKTRDLCTLLVTVLDDASDTDSDPDSDVCARVRGTTNDFRERPDHR